MNGNSKEQQLFEIDFFCSIINVTFDQFNTSLLQYSILLCIKYLSLFIYLE